ncbi:MAG: hypothetical protein JSU69_00990 [Candidatus Zixiibacteriota bacterium]|nr:MAG: hypothetical protein JSU69_00990 [candidate division Zixibacteria bacterium]
MSTRFKSARYLAVLVVAASLLAIAGSQPAWSQDGEPTPFRIEIGKLHNVELGQTISVPIAKAWGSETMTGFDFLIGYNTEALTLLAADEGELFDEPYQWEYFTYRIGPPVDCDSTCPSGLVRIVGVADVDNGAPNPPQPIADGLEMFSLRFVVTQSHIYECTFLPLRFLWTDCGDNAIAYEDPTGTYTAVSKEVYDFDGWNITDTAAGFPTFSGAPDECLEGGTLGSPVRFADYANGGIDILCDSIIGYRGDINLNGVAYEIADYIVFTNYFLYGLSAFTLNIEAQIAATDVNADEIPLTLQDYMYLIRVITGDFVPYPSPAKGPTDTLTAELFIIDTDSSILIRYQSEDTLAVMHFCFYAPDLQSYDDYEIVTFPALEGMDVGYATHSDSLKILIQPHGFDSASFIAPGSGDLLEIHYTGSRPVFAYASAAGRWAEYVDLTVTTGPVPFSIEMGVRQDVMLGHDTTIPVVKAQGSEIMAGFDMLIGYDASALTATTVVPGGILEDPYNWEYFNFRYGPPGDCDGNCPSGMLKIIGVADVNDGIPNPPQVVADGTLLFYVDFLVSSDRTLLGTFVPIWFFWVDCGDNAIALEDSSGTIVTAISDRVYGHEGADITDTAAGLPGYYGAPDLCLNPANLENPARFANYHNGGMYILEEEPIDYRGDINLNGIANEIADYVVFTNYFLYGLSAFIINVETQTAASDINADTIKLTLQDLVYLARIIKGDFLPFPSPAKGPTDTLAAELFIINTDSSILIRYQSDDTLGALHFCFYAPDLQSPDDYEIEIFPALQNMAVGYDMYADSLKILIHWPQFDSAGFIAPGYGDLLEIHYTGSKPVFAYASAAGFWAEYVDLTVTAGPDLFRIEVGDYANAPRWGDISIPVFKAKGNHRMYGFDLTFKYDARVTSLLDVTPGELFEIPGSYEWEYFHYRVDSFTYPVYDPHYPPSVIHYCQVIGIAEIAGDAHHPLEFSVVDSTVLFNVDFHVTGNVYFACNLVPIRFFWFSCGDNMLVFGDQASPETAVSNRVLEEYKDYFYELTSYDYGLPGMYGTPNSCLATGETAPIRLVDFYNGFIDIECDTLNDLRGDVNLNGISYEIGDWNVFTDYFMNGPAAFETAVDSQVNATDINGDRRTVTTEDYTYMMRIIEGEMEPELPIRDTIWALRDDADSVGNLTIGLYNEDTLGVVYVTLWAEDIASYSIELLPRAAEMTFIDTYIDDTLKVLVHKNPATGSATGRIDPGYGDILKISYTGEKPYVTKLSPAGYFGERVIIYRSIDMYDRGDLNQNGIGNEFADAVTYVNYFIEGISVFYVDLLSQLAASDINGDSRLLTLEDYTYLLRIIDGQLLPYVDYSDDFPGSFEGLLTLTETDSTINVSSDFEQPVGALQLIYYAPGLASHEVSFDSSIEHMNPFAVYEDDTLRVLILGYPAYFQDTLILAIDTGHVELGEISYDGDRPQLTRAEAGGYLGEYVTINLVSGNNLPPAFDSCPSVLNNDYFSGFHYDFNAVDQNEFPDQITYEILSGPGTINPTTGEWSFAPVCEDIGATFTLEVCASDPFFPCPQTDPGLHVSVELSVANDPPILGDSDHNGSIQLIDVIYIINYLYKDGPAPFPSDEVSDVDGNARINILDAGYIIKYLYANGPEPICP